MLGNSWIGQVANGHYETEIVPLKLQNGTGNCFEGQGFLTWTNTDGVRIEALTTGTGNLLSQCGKAPCPPGQILPDEYFLQLEGETRNGQSVSIKRILPDDYHIYAGHSLVAWRIRQPNVLSTTVIEDSVGATSRTRCTELLLPVEDFHWPRSSDTTYDNPHFGSHLCKRDWLESECSGVNIAAQQLNPTTARVRIDYSDEKAAPVESGVGLAFSFLVGRRVAALAEESVNGTIIRRVIYLPQRRKTKSRFPRPLRNDPRLDGDCENLFSSSVNFFCTEQGREVGSLLCMCLDSTDSTFTSHALVICVALESLIKLLAPHVFTTQTLSDEQKAELLSCIRSMGLGERVVNRFSGFSGRMDELSPKNLLRAWADKGLLGISKEDVQAWDRLRNRAAHGAVLLAGGDYAERQKEITALDRIKNVLNKLILNAMKYEGHFFDLNEISPKPFAGADLSAI